MAARRPDLWNWCAPDLIGWYFVESHEAGGDDWEDGLEVEDGVVVLVELDLAG